MIDTIEFDLHEGNYHVTKPEAFFPNFDVMAIRDVNLLGLRLHPRIEMKDNAKQYYPQVSAYHYTRRNNFNKEQRRLTNIKVRCSIPKFIKGENLLSIREEILNTFCIKMAGVLDLMGVQTSPENIANAKVCEVHIAHNIIIPVPVYMVLGDLERALVPTNMDINKVSFKNGGLEVQHYYKSWELAFYDKTRDMENLIFKSKSPIKKDNFSPLEIYELCKDKHVFRMELRIKDTAYLNNAIHGSAKKRVFVRELFNNSLIHSILLKKWEHVEENIFILPEYRDSTQRYIAELAKKNPKKTFKFLVRIIPIVMMLAEHGVRATRKFLMACGNPQVKTEALMREAKNIKISRYMPNYISLIGKELRKFIPLTKELLTEDVKHRKLLLNMNKFEFYTIEEVAKMLKLSRMSIYRYIDDGKLSAYKLGRKAYRIAPEDLKAFLKSKKTEKK